MRKSKKPAIAAEWKENKKADTQAGTDDLFSDRTLEKKRGALATGIRLLFSKTASIFAFVSALFIFVSFWTYSIADPGFSVSSGSQPVNSCGVIGAWLSDFFFWFFGLSAYWIIVLLVLFSYRWIRASTETETSKWMAVLCFVGGGFFLLLTSCAIESLQLGYLASHLPAGAGGQCGQGVISLLLPLMGLWGTTLFLLALFIVCIGAVFRFSWLNVCEKIGVFLDCLWEKRANRIGIQGENKNEQMDKEAASWLKKVSEHNVPIKKPATTRISNAGVKALQRDLLPEEDPRLVPSIHLLDQVNGSREGISEETIRVTSRLIESKLKTYRVKADVVGAQAGPVITQYWLQLADGVKGSHVEDIRKDLTRALAVHSVRVVPVIPGKPYMGLEIPNGDKQRLAVYLREIISSENFDGSHSLLSLALGKDIAGHPIVVDLARMPHILVGGTTGSGKSVAVNSMILSLLYKCDPSQLRLVLIDPKAVEFYPYQDIPHLLCPVVTDMSKASNALAWLVREMERRYNLMSRLGVRSFDSYNEKVKKAADAGNPIMDPFDVTPENPEPHTPLEPLPYIVCFIDELADLILVNRKHVEVHIMRLVQKARAAGMHMVLATQRPSVDIVTPLIKTNIAARICFQVASRFDSQVVLDENGAQDLLGRGDMLFRKPGENTLIRIQGCMVSEAEVNRVCEDLKNRAQPKYLDDVTEEETAVSADGSVAGEASRGGEKDPYYDAAVKLVLDENRATTSFVQRRFNIGYNRAANILESMEAAGIVSKPNAAGKREILVQNN